MTVRRNAQRRVPLAPYRAMCYLAPMDTPPENDDALWVAVHPQDVVDGARGALSLRQAKLWALVLEARNIEHLVEPCTRGWRVLVPDHQVEDACRELRLFVDENRGWPPRPSALPERRGSTLAALSVLMLLATFNNVMQLDLTISGHPIDWLDAGSAQSRLIIEGEWWRCITALTLHADWLHLISNIAIGAIFIATLCNDLGSGLAWSLLLGCGFLGNLANAHLQLPSHNSIGASTVVFAAVGLLGGLATLRSRTARKKRWPLPVAAALSLLVLLGSEGKQTDLGAHLLGFLFGMGAGWLTAHLIAAYGRPRRVSDALLAAASAAALVGAWWKAILSATG